MTAKAEKNDAEINGAHYGFQENTNIRANATHLLGFMRSGRAKERRAHTSTERRKQQKILLID